MLIILLFLISCLSINSVFARNRRPHADVGGPYSGIEGEALIFDGSDSSDSDGTIDSWLWDFGDGETSTDQNPAHAYAQDGTYSVSLLVTDNKDATDEDTTSAVVADIDPVADFSASPTSGTEPSTVTFSDLSTSYDGISSWLWDFGDGQTSNDQNPSHIFDEGIYTVSLTVEEADVDSDTETQTDYITVADIDPVADFSALSTSGIVPFTVAFIDASVSYDGVVSWLWEFGDGKSSTEPNPTHIYVVGSFTVSLTVEEEDGDISTKTKPKFVNIEHPPNSSPTADFIIGSSTIPVISEPISFLDNSIDTDGSVTSWSWNFGDTTTSTTQNPTHSYQSTGTFTVFLTVKDDDGATDTKTKQVTISEFNPPETIDDYDKLWHKSDFTITLLATDDYSGVAETYYKINNGPTQQLSVVGQPQITTDGANNTLEYWSVDNTRNEETHHTLLAIKLDKSAPTADAGQDITVTEDAIINFDGTNSHDNIGPIDYTWSLLDGTIQKLAGANPQYIFHTPGVFNVNLTVTDAALNSAHDTILITVLDITAPLANAGDDMVVNEGNIVTFDGSATTDNVGIVSYNWTFTEVIPQTLIGIQSTYIFESAGVYQVTLTALDVEGNMGTDTVVVNVIDSTWPVADAGPDQNVIEDTLVYFDGSASSDNVGITSYVWTLIDAGEVKTMYGEKTSYVFKNLGVYLVSLRVSDPEGHSSIDTRTIIVTDNTTLSIDEDDDANGISDEWESISDLEPLNPLDAAFEGNRDGMNHIEEYQNDANPKVDESEEHILASVLVVAVTISMICYGILYSRSIK